VSGVSRAKFPKSAHLLKHADFRRVYENGKRHFSGNLTAFYLGRSEEIKAAPVRIGFTVSRALGGSVDRNRIRRRTREAVRSHMDQLAGIAEPVDIVFTSENYHDFQNMGMFLTDTNALDKAAFAALKPGGVYVVTDYVSAPGTGKTQTQALHRIDPAVIKQEVQAAGFMLEGESNALMNPGDNLTGRSGQGSSQIMLKFRKPR